MFISENKKSRKTGRSYQLKADDSKLRNKFWYVKAKSTEKFRGNAGTAE
jgi:hypothetical protein